MAKEKGTKGPKKKRINQADCTCVCLPIFVGGTFPLFDPDTSPPPASGVASCGVASAQGVVRSPRRLLQPIHDGKPDRIGHQPPPGWVAGRSADH